MAPSTPLPPVARETLSTPARPELTGGRRVGVLLSHGITGNPTSMTPWGRHLADQGYAVEVPLLPGHGTTWEDANKTTWADWYGRITEVFDKLSAEVDSVVVGGLSMGGAVALRLAADRGDQVAGVVVVNPALASRRKDLLALPLLKHVVGGFPAIGNDIKKPGGNEYPYPKTPLKALHTFVQQWKPLIADLPRITQPLLIFRSADDHVVDSSSVPIITGRVSSRDVTERVLENSYHVATLDNDAETIFEESAAFVARVTAPAADVR
ncbi:alpha/beta fold hydrolase [Nocardioides agariphilus]|uniref:Alpha/beta fold hydrolase n=1 Tax=Nocardioides agariphilus TaxID=433664 RepID=A0A930VGT0_9ACTN|nr:alpha/beta fold hydrolase [Nocardioides agariphilus]